MPHPDQEGKYLLLSGHRRCAAIRQLVDDGLWDVIGHSPNDRPGGASTALVPCTVRQYRSEAMAELQPFTGQRPVLGLGPPLAA